MQLARALLHPAAKPLVFVASLLPFAWLFYGALTDNLGANPAEYLSRATGDWTLRFLCLTLAITPLRVTAIPAASFAKWAAVLTSAPAASTRANTATTVSPAPATSYTSRGEAR